MKWGEETTDEMSVALVHLVPQREEDMPTLRKEQGKRIVGGIDAQLPQKPIEIRIP